MKGRAGYILVCGGAMLGLASYAFHFPAKITVGGHTGNAFAISAALSLAITIFGILLIRRAAR